MIIPGSTYRVQFNKNFTLEHFEEIIEYLNKLGITTVYASPLLQATKDSEHCYDVTDPDAINKQIGTEKKLAAISRRLKSYNMTWLQDIVPNHMAFDSSNFRLMDVLERGKNSSYAGYFDIDWNHNHCKGKLMVPFLDGSLEKALAENQIKLSYSQDGLFLSYFSNLYPLNLESYKLILSELFPASRKYFVEMFFRLKELIAQPYNIWKKARTSLLQELFLINEQLIIRAIDKINNDLELLTSVVNNQYYVLCDFRETNKHINYRRFFSINSLICLRMEDEKVFEDYHRYTYSLYKKGLIQGLRIDHIDGLKDPATYIKRLRNFFGKDCYIIAEKILEIKEELPANLQIEGTSGYEFLSYINQVITDMKGAEKLVKFYNEMMPTYKDYEQLVFGKKITFLKTCMQGEWSNLHTLLLDKHIIDDGSLKVDKIKEALAVFMASFPVYRTYTNKFPIDDISRQYIDHAFNEAEKRTPELKKELVALRTVFEPFNTSAHLPFIQRLMQFTGPLAAKGVEDTTFYVYNPLISHNEVGDQPCVLGIPIQTFHEKMQKRVAANPYSLNCTSTHDTKRGEDGRIRINVLSEVPNEWIDAVKEWQQANIQFKRKINGQLSPTINDEYFLYQSIVGSMPEDLKIDIEYIDRTKKFFTKALREAKINSTHDAPVVPYENACSHFIEEILKSEPFVKSMKNFMKKILEYAAVYSLEQVIIKATAPGIPDFYQGCELWDLSYVDPDNRRAVDFNKRKKMLYHLHEMSNSKALAFAQKHIGTGVQKLFVTYKMLHYRKSNPELFMQGAYIPVNSGNGERLILSYVRKHNDKYLFVVLPLNISCSNTDTFQKLQLVLPEDMPKEWRNIFTNQMIKTHNPVYVHTLFKKFPVSVYESK